MKPRLISFNLCPFVQRSAIVLAHKDIEHDIEFIDLSDVPAWFLELSPLKKVPVLDIGEHVIFDSTVINEFLNEAYPGQLHPDDVFDRAMNRSWIEYGGECLMNSHRMAISLSEKDFHEERNALWTKLDRLEEAVVAGPYFNGPNFSLVDAAYAPMFQRLDFLEDLGQDIYDRARHPKLHQWKTRLLDLDSVKRSSVPDLQTVFYDFIGKYDGYFRQYL